jgi:hypothetical protein
MLVCKRFKEAVDQNQLWRSLTERRFPFFQKPETVASGAWKELYQHRCEQLKNPNDGVIENCFQWLVWL